LVLVVLNNELIQALFSFSETSNSMKIGMLDSYLTMLGDPLTLLFGQGYNSYEWSADLRKIIAMDIGASKTELTYLELVRVYGLVWAALFMAFLVRAVYGLKEVGREFRWLYFGFFVYLLNCSLNPYLFSTNGILPLALITSVIATSKVHRFDRDTNDDRLVVN